jgi:ribonuclease HI
VKSVTIYSDGACLGNPGPGGYGVILDHNGTRIEKSAGYRLTTNNRMELLGVITGLESLKAPSNALVVTDSVYVINGIEKGWAIGWRARGWRTAGRTPAKNVDLWKRLLDLCEQHTVAWEWVKGHNGHPENERCDELANAAAAGSQLLVDDGYESPPDRLL